MVRTPSRLATLGLAAVLTTSLVVPAAPVAASAGSSAGSPGSDGVGDEYFPKYGNGGYDVRRYDISVRFNPRNERLHGRTEIEMVPNQRLSRFNLDLVLGASQVRVNGAQAAFSQTAHELRITPVSPLRRGELATVVVRYAGVPSRVSHNGYNPWITTADGAVALGQPEIAAWWFPSNDHPVDKARYAIHLTVPNGKQAISAGRFEGRERNGPWTTWNWTLASRAATYLVFAAIGDYRIRSGETDSGRPYFYAIGEHLGDRIDDAATASMTFTDDAVDFLERRWGRYPFTQIGGVVPSGFDIGYALETQTRPVYDAGFFSDGQDRSVVIHEMAHQWFGDSVAVHRWKNIWLNEGFATYSEWLYRAVDGPTADVQFRRLHRSIPARDRFWDLRIGDPGPTNLFDDAVYDRGAMTVQALRNRVGRDDFFRIMRTWARQHADGNAHTKQFKHLAERISGEQLDGLFHAWLFSARKPARTRANGF